MILIKTNYRNPISDPFLKNTNHLVCVVRICAPDSDDDRSTCLKPADSDDEDVTVEECDQLMLYENCRGTTQKTAQYLRDPFDYQSKWFFIFDDLSIRTNGLYRFRCQLIDMSR
jgi:hypothetical protein